MSAPARVFSGATIAMYESALRISCSSMADTFVISSIGATRVNTPPTASKPRRTSAREPRRASSRATSSISGRAGGWERTSTCQPGWASMQSTSTRAYAWIRGSTRGILVGCGEFEPDTRRPRPRHLRSADGRSRHRGTRRARAPAAGLSVSASTVAVRRTSRSRAISPNESPGPSSPLGEPSTVTLQAAGFDHVEPIAVIALLDDCGARLRRQRPRAPPPSARG